MTRQTLNQQALNAKTPLKQLSALARTSTNLARLVARNPNCSEALLRKLGSHKDNAVRKWVTVHLSTPPEVRLALAQQFPQQLLDSPMLDLLLLENPNLFADMPIGTVRALMKRPNLPVGFIRFAVTRNDESVQLAIAQNRSTPPEIITNLKIAGLSQAVRTAAQAWKAPEPSVDEAETRFWHAFTERLVTSPSASQRTLYQSLLDNHAVTNHNEAWNDAVKTAADPGISDSVQADLANHLSCLVHEALLARESLSETAALTLARLAVPSLKMKMASREGMFPSVLAVLVENGNPALHKLLARNPNTSFPALERLAQEADVAVRKILARLSISAATVLERLVADTDTSVRKVLARNTSTPLPLLERLAQDPDVSVRTILARLANRGATVLERLVDDTDVSVRNVLARNAGAPVRVLDRLAQDPDDFVRKTLASNSHTSVFTLRLLAQDSNVYVRQTVAKNYRRNVSMILRHQRN